MSYPSLPIQNPCFQPACCAMPHEDTPAQWFCVVEKITAVALATFAFQVSAESFIPFFLLGIAIGAYQTLTSDPSELDEGSRMGCSRGLMEQLTRVKLPRLVSLATDVAVMWCHIDHHATVFVPMIAIYAGAKTAMNSSNFFRRHFSIQLIINDSKGQFENWPLDYLKG